MWHARTRNGAYVCSEAPAPRTSLESCQRRRAVTVHATHVGDEAKPRRGCGRRVTVAGWHRAENGLGSERS